MNRDCATYELDPIDRVLIRLTQAGLPLVPQPYRDLGDAIGIAEAEVMLRMRRMLDRGVIRRIAAVPNHYALGYRANGMSVWDVPDERADEMGRAVGALPFVTHCYRRPRYLPDWPYNLFAMVHGRTREEVAEKVAAIEALIGPECRGHEVLYSTRILKKTGLRLAA
ncbi:MAG TPA: AsnC family transcriptional regulator [Burkholderiales bacterium]|nr:AsnC family transcriptional regulator [Burkholderiales bacterium]